MLSANLILLVCLGYVALLFVIAFVVDRFTARGRMNWLSSPVIYTLSISVYCTAWTFYGAVGSAARNGLEFVTIYLGPTLVFVGWWFFLRKLVRIGRAHRITSIADLISSRYGKSPSIAVLVTLVALLATTPYIALQLQSVTRSYQVIAGEGDNITTSFWVAAGMALFTILFGTRNLDANERHHGVVAAIAIEAVVKFVALVTVGLFAIYGVSGGLDGVFANIPPEVVSGGDGIFGPRWVALTFLSATAVICLPRQFQVTVVENIDEDHLRTASWLFPLYLFGMCLFIVPIAVTGLQVMPAGSNPDLFVLTLPLAAEREELALLAFLGGFSSATSMVIVASIAVSTMVSNHIVMPIALRFMARGNEVSGDVRELVLVARRISIAAILGLGLLYFWASGGSDALAAIGLISFAGVAQFLPSMVGGIFWRGATRTGAFAGLSIGLFLWAYTLLLPSIASDVIFSTAALSNGPWGIGLLRPYELLGLTGLDPLVHALVWSLGLNMLIFLGVSSFSEPAPLERLQGALFVDVFRSGAGSISSYSNAAAEVEDLFVLAQRILGAAPARMLFDEMARSQGRPSGLPAPTDAVVIRLERELAGSIGAASAHAMVSRIAGGESVGVNELITIADETQRLIETSRQLALKSEELEAAAIQLRDVNERLRALDAQKDGFLSQVSHELRTPMTSIRSFSEIITNEEDLPDEDRKRFIAIIHEESVRLSGLLDEILDINRLEAGALDLSVGPVDAGAAVVGAIELVSGLTSSAGVSVVAKNLLHGTMVQANQDRLRQILLNLLSNAVKYNQAADPAITIETRKTVRSVMIDVIDNGGGVSAGEASMVFEKFTRGSSAGTQKGAGLGLPISRAILQSMGGNLWIEFTPTGTSFFRVELPLSELT